MPNLPFPFDFERVIDDWVFMCFFVGNDFLPHLPSLEIREGAIDRLVNLYKKTVYKTGGFLTNSGNVNLNRVQLIMQDLGEMEDEIFKKRQENELAFRRREKDKKKRQRLQDFKPVWMPKGQYQPQAVGSRVNPISNPRREAFQQRMDSYNATNPQAGLKAMMREGDAPHGTKRKAGSDEESDEEPNDEVRLWEDGFKDRYYESKFDVSSGNVDFRVKVAHEYVYGLCWVLKYYYQGCASWKWYFPYHYAPFASDFINIGDLSTDFEKGTIPFRPLEQLMGVFPAASRSHVPEPWGELMTDPHSPIIDFYPEDFKIDLNGKKFAWQGVALLPFVDEKRLFKALEPYYAKLTMEEIKRNVRGDDRLYIRHGHPGHSFLSVMYESSNDETEVHMEAELFNGTRGAVLIAENCVRSGETLHSPVNNLPPIEDNLVMCVRFRDPKYPDSFLFPARRLQGAIEPPKVLKPGDLSREQSRNWRPQIGMGRSNQRASLDRGGHRMINHSVGRHNPGPGVYSAVPPPSPLLGILQPLLGLMASNRSNSSNQDYNANRNNSNRGRDGHYGGRSGNQDRSGSDSRRPYQSQQQPQQQQWSSSSSNQGQWRGSGGAGGGGGESSSSRFSSGGRNQGQYSSGGYGNSSYRQDQWSSNSSGGYSNRGRGRYDQGNNRNNSSGGRNYGGGYNQLGGYGQYNSSRDESSYRRN